MTRAEYARRWRKIRSVLEENRLAMRKVAKTMGVPAFALRLGLGGACIALNAAPGEIVGVAFEALSRMRERRSGMGTTLAELLEAYLGSLEELTTKRSIGKAILEDCGVSSSERP